MEQMEQVILLTEQIGVILKQEQLRGDQSLDQSKVEELIQDSDENVKLFVADFMYEILKDQPGQEEAEHRIKDFVQAVRDIGNEQSADYLENALKKKLEKESGKSVSRRRFEKHAGLIVLLLFVIALVGVKLYYRSDTGQPLLSRPGMENIIRLGQKIKYHDDVITSNTRARKGGLIKSIILWPLQVSDEEIGYYQKYIILLSRVGYELKQGGHACGIGDWAKAEDQEYTTEDYEQLIKIAEAVNDEVKDPLSALPEDISSQDMISFIAGIMADQYPCAADSGE